MATPLNKIDQILAEASRQTSPPAEETPPPESERESRIDDILRSAVEDRNALNPALKPDQAARDVQLSRDTKLPLNVILDRRDELLEQQRRREYQARVDRLNRESPRLAAQLGRPGVREAASDDLDTLSAIEKAWIGFKSLPRVAGAGIEQAVGGFAGLGGGILSVLADMYHSVKSKPPLLSTYFPEVDPATVPESVQSVLNTRRAETLGDRILRNVMPPQNPFERHARALLYAQRDAERAAEIIRGDEVKQLPQWAQQILLGAESGFASLFSMALGGAAGRMTMPATSAPGRAEVAARTARSTNLMAGVAAGHSVPEALDAGLTATQALAYATGQGLIERLTEHGPLFDLISDVKGGAGFAKTLFRNFLNEAVGEQTATVLQDMHEMVALRPDMTFADYRAERPEAALSTLFATLGGVGVQTSVLTAVERVVGGTTAEKAEARARATYDAPPSAAESLARRINGIQEQETLFQLIEHARHSKLAGRDGQLFDEIVERLGDNEGVYVDAEALRTFAQENPDGFGVLLQSVPEISEQLDEAIALSGDVILPASKVIRAFAQNEVLAPLQAELRLSEDSVTESAYEDLVLNQVVPEMDREQAHQESVLVIDQTIERLESEIIATGQTPKLAKIQAAAFRSFYETQRARLAGDEASTAALDAEFAKLSIVRGDTQPTQLQQSAVAPAFTDTPRVSTRVPWGAKFEEDSFTTELNVGELPTELVEAEDDYLNRVSIRVRERQALDTPDTNYVGVPGQAEGTEPRAAAESFIQHVMDNLRWVYNQIPPEIRERSRLWYVGANRLTNRLSARYGVSPESVAGVFAALSPQKDWFMNASLGERVIDIWHNHQDTRWDRKMGRTAGRIYKKPKFAPYLRKIRGKTLGELADLDVVHRAMWIRIYDETYNDHRFRVLSPEGEFLQYATNIGGNETIVTWQSNEKIANALSMLEDPRMENINIRLGGNHKVRNFYNNIIDPDNPVDVTIDTHAVAASLLLPVGSKDIEAEDNFGTPAASIIGYRGTYALYAQAHRRLAAELGILPRELQSITWEAVRNTFSPGFKTAGNKTAVKEIWQEVERGEETPDGARERIFAFAGGLVEPEWVTEPARGVHEGLGDTSYSRELPGGELAGRRARSAAGRRRAGDAERAPAARVQGRGTTLFQRGAGTAADTRSVASPIPVGGRGDVVLRDVYSRFGKLGAEDTTESLKIYNLDGLVENPEQLDQLLDAIGWKVEVFSFHEDKEAGVEVRIPRLKQNYDKGVVWIYDPRVAHGSFKDETYTRAWRITHEIGHGLTERFMEEKYGPSRRYGRLGREMTGQRGVPPKRVDVTLKPLTLTEAQRAVEWEDVAFRAQRMILERLGITISDEQFAQEYNTNISDAVFRVTTGDFGNPGEYGLVPNTTLPDLGAVLGSLQATEQELAQSQQRDQTSGIDLDSWQPVPETEIEQAVDELLGDYLGRPRTLYQQGGLQPAGPTAGRGDGQAAVRGDGRVDSPPVREDGTVELTHWSYKADLEALDPAYHGTGLSGAERKRKEQDPDNWVDRTYYGIAVGRPGGYVKEPGLGPNQYSAVIEAEGLYDWTADPEGHKKMARAEAAETGGNAHNIAERHVRDAGYKGYWVNHPSLGLVAAVYERLPAARVYEQAPPAGSGNFLMWFGTSRVAEIQYHGTVREFEEFRLGDIGAHFGTRKAAHDILRMRAQYAEPLSGVPEGRKVPPGGVVLPVWLKIENPLQTWDMGGQWDVPQSWIEYAERALQQIKRGQVASVTKAQAEAIMETAVEWDEGVTIAGDLGDEAIYRVARREFAAAMRETLGQLGFDGIVYENEVEDRGSTSWVVFDPTQVKSALGNQQTFDPTDPSILRQATEHTAEEARGAITFDAEQTVITLFETADLSTLLHEAAHFFVETQRQIARLPTTPQTFKDDVQAMYEWVGSPDGRLTREQHEKLARGFELYLREGRAPSVRLRRVFRSFRRWLVNVYRQVRQLDVEINNDLRAVFDRMLATEDEIDALLQEPHMNDDPAFLSLLTKTERGAYMRRLERRAEKAKEKLLAQMLRELTREAKHWWKEARAQIRREQELVVDEMPVYKAWHFLRTGKLLDRPTPDGLMPFKLDRAAVKQLYGDAAYQRLPRGITGKDGEHPDMVAELFGAGTGAELIKMLGDAVPRDQLLDKLADQEMLARHGDILNDGSIARRAREAVENDDRTQALLYELRVLSRQTGGTVAARQAFENAVQRLIDSKPVQEVTQTSKYYSAEVRAAREAGKALGRGDYVLAAEWKRKQILNHMLFREGNRIRADLARTKRRFRRYLKPLRKGQVRMDEDYHQMVSRILGEYQLGPRLQPLGREELHRWLQQAESDDGADMLQLHGSVLASPGIRPRLEELPVAEYEGLRDTVDNIAAQGRMKNRILVEGQARDRKQLGLEIRESILQNFEEKGQVHQPELPWNQVLHKVRAFLASTLKAGPIIRRLDGFRHDGLAQRVLLRPINVAEREKVIRLRQVSKEVDELFRKYYGGALGSLTGLRQKLPVPQLGKAGLTKEGIVAMALNWGNSDNRQKLLDGREGPDGKPWTEEAVLQAFAEHMTENDWAFVEEVWAYLDKFWPEIAALDKKTRGVTPERVEPEPFIITSSDGVTMEMSGGYYPLKFDPGEKGAPDPYAMTMSDLMRTGRFGSAQTRKGHTETRVQGHGLAVRLSFSPFLEHVNQVVTDLTMREAVENVWRVLKTDSVARTLERTIGREQRDFLEIWVKDVAVGAVVAEEGISSWLDGMRAGTSVSVMGFKASTALVQFTGINHTLATLGPMPVLRGLSRFFGVGRIDQMNANVVMAWQKSQILQNRQVTFHRDVYDTMRRLQRAGRIRAEVARYSFVPLVTAQLFVDTVTWLAAYEVGLKNNDGNERLAVEFADTTVERTQGSGAMSTLSAFERGSTGAANRLRPFVRLMTTFYSYYNTKLNLAYEYHAATDYKKPGQVLRLGAQYLTIFWLEALIGEMILQRMPDFDDDEEDPWWWHTKLILKQLGSLLPGIREISASAQGFSGAPAGLRGLEAIGEGLGAVGQATVAFLEDEEIEGTKLARALAAPVGILFKIPTLQFAQALKAMEKSENGEDVAPIDYILNIPDR